MGERIARLGPLEGLVIAKEMRRQVLNQDVVWPFRVESSVDTRMRSFQDSIAQLLWPERREKDPLFANENGPGVGVIGRTSVDSNAERGVALP